MKINEEFLPDRYQKYLLQNYQMSEMYRAYKSNIPAYLKGRPRQVIMHCLERLRKRQKIMKTTIIPLDNGHFQIKSQSNGEIYSINLDSEEKEEKQ